jgi:hypothetical protein
MTVWKQTTHAGMPHLVYRVEREGSAEVLAE